MTRQGKWFGVLEMTLPPPLPTPASVNFTHECGTKCKKEENNTFTVFRDGPTALGDGYMRRQSSTAKGNSFYGSPESILEIFWEWSLREYQEESFWPRCSPQLMWM